VWGVMHHPVTNASEPDLFDTVRGGGSARYVDLP